MYMLNARGHSVIHGNWEYQNSNPLYFILFIYLLPMPDNICLLYFYIYLSKIWIKDVRCYESLLLKIQHFLKCLNLKRLKSLKLSAENSF